MIVVEGRARAAIFSCRSPCCASGTRRGAATSTAPGSVESSRGVAGSTRSPRAAPRPGRCARGGGVLAVAVCAVLAGAKSLSAVGEWAADAPPQGLLSLGIRPDPLTGGGRAPDEATVRRGLAGGGGHAPRAPGGARPPGRR